MYLQADVQSRASAILIPRGLLSVPSQDGSRLSPSFPLLQNVPPVLLLMSRKRMQLLGVVLRGTVWRLRRTGASKLEWWWDVKISAHVGANLLSSKILIALMDCAYDGIYQLWDGRSF